MSLRYWTSSCGRLELALTFEDASSASHQGQCDEDVRALSEKPDVRAQLDAWSPEDVRHELAGYGAWDEDSELKDHEQNLQRMLWLAAGSIVDTQDEEEEQ